jgi:hypothetical protein
MRRLHHVNREERERLAESLAAELAADRNVALSQGG